MDGRAPGAWALEAGLEVDLRMEDRHFSVVSQCLCHVCLYSFALSDLKYILAIVEHDILI